MDSGNTRELAESKVILLYIIDRLNMKVSCLQIIKIILENKFMNYFYLQQYINELCESKFLNISQIDGKTFYDITGSGKQALGFFSTMIPAGIKARIDESIISIRRKLKNETLIKADFMPESEKEFIVSCSIGEDDFLLLDLRVMVGTKNDARAICSNWEKHSQEIYSELIESITKTREVTAPRAEQESDGIKDPETKQG